MENTSDYLILGLLLICMRYDKKVCYKVLNNSMITYAYMRVSTKEQNLERQYQAIKDFRPDLPETNIFYDKQTGKDFNREQYQAMKIIL